MNVELCSVDSGVYIPVEADDGHWVKRMWTYSDITKSKVRVEKKMLLLLSELYFVAYCISFGCCGTSNAYKE